MTNEQTTAKLKAWLAAAPKAELHLHLEGSIQPATLLTLARRNGVDLPADTIDGLNAWFQFRDFQHFIEVYVTITRCLRRVEDYETIVREAAAELARQNARYAEMTFTPGTHDWLGVKRETWMEGLRRGREAAKREFGVEIAWVFDIVRGGSLRGQYEDFTTEAAIEGREMGVAALGLSGPEAGHPPGPFARWFDRAREAGLRATPHSGEHAGPDYIRQAVGALGADRIGHGVRAIEDSELTAMLAERRIALEINPTSNIRLGVYPSYREHPLRRLHEAGVLVTVNTDDPPLFGTTLNDEAMLLIDEFGFGLAEIETILLNAVRCSFQPEASRSIMENRFRAEMERLKGEMGL